MTAKKTQFHPTKFSALVKRHEQPQHTADPNAVDPVALLISSFLMYDAPSHMAEAAMQKIRSATVDFNEFRVSLVEEMVQMIGVRYPRAEERCKALRRVLYDIFRHHHKVSLSHLEGHPKQHIRAYLDNLDGMIAYVSNRVCLLRYGVHAIPVDQTTHELLVEEGALSPTVSLSDAAGVLERNIRAGHGLESYFALQAAADKRHAAGPKAAPKAAKAEKASKPQKAPKSSKPASKPSKPASGATRTKVAARTKGR
jgi:endonuclease III